VLDEDEAEAGSTKEYAGEEGEERGRRVDVYREGNPIPI